jgi:hypothetical protein
MLPTPKYKYSTNTTIQANFRKEPDHNSTSFSWIRKERKGDQLARNILEVERENCGETSRYTQTYGINQKLNVL